MTIEKLSSLTVKVSLSKNELEKYSLCFDLLENNNKNTRELIAYLVYEIRQKTGVNLYNEHLYIEAFANANYGCILYISAVDTSINEDEEDNFPDIILLEADNEKNIIKFSKNYMKYFFDKYNKSMLYIKDGIYRIILHINAQKFENIIDSALSNNLKYTAEAKSIAYTCEYFNCIFDSKAIEKLSGQELF